MKGYILDVVETIISLNPNAKAEDIKRALGNVVNEEEIKRLILNKKMIKKKFNNI